MRRLLALALLVLAGSAAAAPSCWPDMSRPITVERAEAPTTPIVIGEVVYAASSVGLVWGYTCKAGDGKHYKNIFAGAWSAFPIDWLFVMDTLMRGTDADRSAAYAKYATASAWDERLRPDLDKVWSLLPVPPPPVTWIVMPDPFRADKKRLVYAAPNGKRGLSTGLYVDAGAPCDPSVTIIEFGPVYFLSVLGDKAKVARCAKQ